MPTPREVLSGGWTRWITTLLLLALGTVAKPLFAMDVSGDLNTSQTWRAIDSPVNVQGLVRIRGGATLTIEAGVELRFRPAAALQVESGALAATGSAALPIQFNSDQPTPAPGDWGPLSFLNGTIDQRTQLDNVVIRHGQGIEIHQASPTLNRVGFENNQGAAIRLDLESSPVGVGLYGTSNGLNGILIPPGTITGTVRWGLIGLPYVIEQGAVTVGLPPITLTPTLAELREGQQQVYQVNLAKPAPAGGLALDVVSSVPGVASVPTSITVAAGQTRASFSANALAAGTSTISVSRLELGAVSSQLTVRVPVTLSVTPANVTMGVNQQRTLQIQSSEPAPSGGVNLRISSTRPDRVSVPADLYLDPGLSTVPLTINSHALGAATLSVEANGGYVSASATVQVQPTNLSIAPIGVISPGGSRTATINLSEPAPPGGLAILVTSSVTGVATVTSPINLSAGASIATFTILGIAPGTSTITAAASGYQSATTEVMVESMALSFEPAAPAIIPIGTADQFVLRLSRPAPIGGLQVSLTSANPTSAAVTPSQIVIAEGATAASQPIVVTGLATSSQTLITASADGVTPGTLAVAIVGAPELRLTPDRIVLGKGLSSRITLYRLNQSGAAYPDQDPLTVSLQSSNPAKLALPTTVTIPAGRAFTEVIISGLDLASAIEVEATATGYTAAQPAVAEIIEPTLVFQNLDDLRGVGAARDDFFLSLQVAGSTTSQFATADLPIALGVTEQQPAGVVDGLYATALGADPTNTLTVAAGRADTFGWGAGQGSAYVGSPTTAGTYRISGQIAGQALQMSATQTAADGPRGLRFSLATVELARGLRSEALTVERTNADAPYAGIDPLTIDLATSAPDKVQVPASVSIPAGWSSVVIPLVGIEETTAPASLTASAAGYPSATIADSVTVSQASLGFPYLSTYQTIGAYRNAFFLEWWSPNSMFSALDRPVTVELVEQQPTGIVNNLYANSTGDVLLGPLTLREGALVASGEDGYAAWIYIGSAQTAGSYRVRVSVAGMGTWQSEPITVAAEPPTLHFDRSSDVLGLGMRTSLMINRAGVPLEQALALELRSSNPDHVQVPATISIPAGENAVYVTLDGVGLTTAAETITAVAIGDPSLTTTVEITVVNPEIAVVNLAGRRGIGGERDQFGVRWVVPGALGLQVGISPTVVDLAVADSTPAGMPLDIYAAKTGAQLRSQLTIPAGAYDSGTEPEGSAFLGSPAVEGSYRIHAHIAALGEWMSDLQSVVQPRLQMSLTTHSVGTGMRSDYLEIMRWAGSRLEPPDQAVPIALESSNPASFSLPAVINLDAGRFGVPIPISGLLEGSGSVSASAIGYGPASSADIRVVQPALQFEDTPNSLTIGVSKPLRLQVRVPASSDVQQTLLANTAVNLTSSFPALATVTPTIIIPAGSFTAEDAVVTPIASGLVTITASANSLIPATTESIPITAQPQ